MERAVCIVNAFHAVFTGKDREPENSHGSFGTALLSGNARVLGGDRILVVKLMQNYC